MNETRLLKELFKGYNKHTHPRLPGTGPVTVTFDFQLIDILDVVSFYNLSRYNTCVYHVMHKIGLTAHAFVFLSTECEKSVHHHICLGESGASIEFYQSLFINVSLRFQASERSQWFCELARVTESHYASDRTIWDHVYVYPIKCIVVVISERTFRKP